MQILNDYQTNAGNDCPMPCGYLIIDVADRHAQPHSDPEKSFLKLFFLPRKETSKLQAVTNINALFTEY